MKFSWPARVALTKLSVVVAGITLAVVPAVAQIQTNAFGDIFVTQWTENFTTETSLSSRWHPFPGHPGPTQFAGTNGMTVPINCMMGTAPKNSLAGATLFGRYWSRVFTDPTSPQNQSFWLVNPIFNTTYNNWQEIDIEVYDGTFLQANTIVPTYTPHWGDGSLTARLPRSNDKTVINPVGWHTWMIDWTPNYIAWYMDGNLRYINCNNSTMPGWTELAGNGAEAMLFPESLMFANSGTAAQASMSASSASYAALQLQSFAATNYNGNSWGVTATDVEGNPYVGSLTNAGGYLRYDGVQSPWRNLSIQVDCTNSGAQILIRTNSPTGPVIGTINVPRTRGPEWLYTDLVITNSTSQVVSAKRHFNIGWDATDEVGKTLVITGGTGFTPGTYTITAIDTNGVATLSSPVGVLNSKNGLAALQYPVPIRYTMASANLLPRNGPPQSFYLTFAGNASGLNLYNLHFFGTQPTSWLPTVTLNSSDTVGTSSFSAAGNWSNGQAPSATNNYLNTIGQLFTPADSLDHVFLGNSLTISNGALLSFRGTSSSVSLTVTNLMLQDGGIISQDMTNLAGAYTANLNGSVMLLGRGNTIRSQTAVNEVLNINSVIGGAGSLTIAQKASGAGGTLSTFLNAANTHAGGTFLAASNLANEAAVSLTVTHDGGLGVGTVTVSNLAVLTLTNGVANAYIHNQASLILVGSPTVNLNYIGTNTIYALSFNGGSTYASAGTWGSSTSGAANTSSLFKGQGVLLVNPSNAPPSILLQPASQIWYAGQTGQFNVVATGNPVLTYQWRVGTNGTYVNLSDGGNFTGTATPTLTVSNVAATNAADYVVVLTSSSFGSLTSSVATLTVAGTNRLVWDSFTNLTVHPFLDSINGQAPELGSGTWVSAKGLLQDSTSGLCSEAIGGGNPQAEIAIPPIDLPSATMPVTVQAEVFPTNFNSWVALGFQIVPDTGGSWYVETNLLWVYAGYSGQNISLRAGTVTVRSVNMIVPPGLMLALTYDPATKNYLVQTNGATAFSGTTAITNIIGSAGLFGNGPKASGVPGFRNFGVARVPAVITQQPVAQTVNAGQTAQFTVALWENSPTPSYQWQILSNGTYINLSNGGNLSGATTPTLSISNVFVGAQYAVVITNAYGLLMSRSAPLTVIPGTNAYLRSLRLNPSGALTPAFTTNGFTYWATNNYGAAPTVTVTNADPTAVSGLIYNGTPLQVLTSGVPSQTLTLNVGVTNVVRVLVAAQDGVTTNVYTVNVIELPPPIPYLTNSWNGSSLTLNWPAGTTLLQATNVVGPWTTNAGPSPLYVTPAQPQQFFRVRSN